MTEPKLPVLSALHLAQLNYRQTRIQLYLTMVQVKSAQAEIIALKAAQDMRQARAEEQAGKKEAERLQNEMREFCSAIEGEYNVDFASCSWDDTTGAIHIVGHSTPTKG